MNPRTRALADKQLRWLEDRKTSLRREMLNSAPAAWDSTTYGAAKASQLLAYILTEDVCKKLRHADQTPLQFINNFRWAIATAIKQVEHEVDEATRTLADPDAVHKWDEPLFGAKMSGMYQGLNKISRAFEDFCGDVTEGDDDD